MSDKRIDQYFGTTPRNSKRPKPSTTPEAESVTEDMEQERVGDTTMGHLMTTMTGVLSDLLDKKLSLLATKEEFSNLANKVDMLSEENRLLKQELNSLQSKNKATSEKLLDLESRSRRNNLIFRGVQVTPQTKDYRLVVRQFCKEKFGTDDSLYINRAHPLDDNRTMLIAHFPDDSDVEYIMSRAKLLKGTGYYVYRDYPIAIRHKRACLAAVRSEVERVAGRGRMPLVFDHMYVSGSKFTWEEEGLMAGRSDGAEILQQLFNHDFREFLHKIKETGPGRPHRADGKTKTADNDTSETTTHQGLTSRKC